MCEESEAFFECLQCSKFLCKDCSTKHKSKKKHNFKEISNAYSCTEHFIKCNFYCYNCQETVCANCAHPLLENSKHSKHKTETLKVCEEKTKEKSKKFIEKMKIETEEKEKKIKEVKLLILELKQKLKKKEEELVKLDDSYDELNESILKFEKLDFLEQLKKMEIKQILFDQEIIEDDVKYKGIYENKIKISELSTKGWEIVYDKPYKDSFSFESTKSLCQSKGVYCVGGYIKGNDIINLCAFGVESIFNQTFSNDKAVLIDEVYWYCVKSQSFGFSNEEKISLSNADTTNENLK
jgi:hypothetical protein